MNAKKETGNKRKRTGSFVRTTCSSSSSSSSSSNTSSSSSGQLMAAVTTPFNNDRTVYIQGLPFDATEEDLREFFRDITSSSSTTQGSNKIPVSLNLVKTGKSASTDANNTGDEESDDADDSDCEKEQSEDDYDRDSDLDSSESQGKSTGKDKQQITKLKNASSASDSKNAIVSLRLPRWHDSGRLKGYAHVEFASAGAAQRALEKSGEYIGERYLTIDRPMVPRALQTLQAAGAASSAGAVGDGSSKSQQQQPLLQPRKKPVGCRTIFVKNLPYDVTEKEIIEAFRIYGPIITPVRLACWGHTQKLKGFGYIQFKREDSAELAVRKTGTIVLKGRPTIVDYETGDAKGGYKLVNSAPIASSNNSGGAGSSLTGTAGAAGVGGGGGADGKLKKMQQKFHKELIQGKKRKRVSKV